MLTSAGQGLWECLARILQAPIKVLSKQDPDFERMKLENKAPLKNNLFGAAKRTRSLRKFEFDKLRAVLRHQVAVDEKHRLLFFHSSPHSKMENSASTLKKIDEIEVQMSMQWWKTDRLDLNTSKSG